MAQLPPAHSRPPGDPQPPAGQHQPVAASPVTAHPPVAATSPVTAQPPATGTPPVTAQPPATGTPPVTAQPPVAGTPPVIAQPPVTPQPPVIAQPPAGGTPPVIAQPPAAPHSPVVAPGRATPQSPAGGAGTGLSGGRRIKVAGAFGALAFVAVAVPAGVSFAGTDRVQAESKQPVTQAANFQGVDPRVPPELNPPAGNVLHSVLKARGVQIYECRSGTWTLLEPAASLTGVTMHPVKKVTALHFRGPSWQSDQDGSLLEGDGPNAVRVPSEHPNSIPQLLIKSKLNRGDGVFGKVTYIQRLDTVGGLAPAGACTGSGTTAAPYRAVYRFFVAKP